MDQSKVMVEESTRYKWVKDDHDKDYYMVKWGNRFNP